MKRAPEPGQCSAHTGDSSTWKAESGKSQVQGQPSKLHSKNDSNKQITHRAGNAASHRAEVVRFENDLARPGLSLRSLPRPWSLPVSRGTEQPAKQSTFPHGGSHTHSDKYISTSRPPPHLLNLHSPQTSTSNIPNGASS